MPLMDAEVETSDDVTGAAKDKECAENGKADFLRKNQTGAVLARAGSFFPGFRGIAVVLIILVGIIVLIDVAVFIKLRGIDRIFGLMFLFMFQGHWIFRGTFGRSAFWGQILKLRFMLGF